MRVTFQECYSELVEHGGPQARRAYQQWEARPGYESVVAFVKNFSQEKIFGLRPQDVRNVVLTTEHALGDVPSRHQIPEIEDFTCPFALHHLFHRFIERTGELPTWQRFWRWISHQARPYWLDQIQPLASQLEEKYSQQRIDDAIRWRLGKFYYSALRETDLLVAMHAAGIPLQYHVLADVLLRVDYWIGSTLICLYFPNQRYRENHSGRKPPAENFFRDSHYPFKILNFEIERQGFGRSWLVSDRAKDRLVRMLDSGSVNSSD